MALDPTWQSNYVDLSDERSIRFGAWCVVCGARYVSADEQLDPALPHTPPPGSAAAHAVEEAKYRAFVEFDAAFREITVECYGCEHPACPDCWDEDNRMCGACVRTHGLQRSPHRGVHALPLADGRLRRTEPGQFSEATRPGWLNELLATQLPGAPAAGQPGGSAAMWQGLHAAAPEPPFASMPQVARAASAADSSASALGSVAAEPTKRITTMTPPPAPTGTHNRSGTSGRIVAVGHMDAGDYPTPEGKATSNMVECPRCHTANYDFVTRCTVCQLQLIQICPLCERLNPGHAKLCEGCGSPLDRPAGWSEVRAQVTPISPGDARRRLEQVAPPAKPPRRARHTWPRRGDSGRMPAKVTDGWQQPTPAQIAQPAAAPAPTPAAALVGGGAIAMPAHVEPAIPDAVAIDADGGVWNTVLLTLERITTAVLLLAILGLVGAVLAAELSASADAALKTMIHVDVREALAHFWSWLQTLWHREQK